MGKFSQRINATIGNEITAVDNYSCLRNLMRIAAKTFKTTIEEIITFITEDPNDPSVSLRSGTFNNYCRTGKVSEYACNIFYEFFEEEIELDVFTGKKEITLNACIIMLSIIFFHLNQPQNSYNVKANVFFDYSLSIEDFKNSIDLALDIIFAIQEETYETGSNIFVFEDDIEYIQSKIAESLKPYIIPELERRSGGSQIDSIYNDPDELLVFMDNLTIKIDLNVCLVKGPEYIRKMLSAIDKQKEFFGYILKLSELRN